MKAFAIGDKAFTATYSRHEKAIVCPDCLGSRHVVVVLGDGTQVTIECGGCDPGGYQPSTGFIKQYEFAVILLQGTITGIRQVVPNRSIEYELSTEDGCTRHMTEDEVFVTKEEAQAFGESQRVAEEAEENKRFLAKTKDHRSWAWHATYHRNYIKDLERQLAWHNSKILVCKKQTKDSYL